MMLSEIIQGNCLDVMRGMEVDSVDAVITDPPYGTGTRKWDRPVNPDVWAECKRLCPKGPIAIFGYAKQMFQTAPYFIDMMLIGFIVWHKYNEIVVSRGLTRAHQDVAIWGNTITQCKAADVREPYQSNANQSLFKFFGGGELGKPDCTFGNRLKGAKPHPEGRRCTDLWKIVNKFHGFNAHLRFHPNQKPDELMNRLIRLLSNEGQLVLDPFCGSGTTGVAAKTLKRDFIGIELSAEYCKIAERRIATTMGTL